MNSQKKYIIIFAALCVVLLVIIQAYFIYVKQTFGKLENASVYGDSFGALNAVFSGLAFAGVIVTVLIQMEELRATRDELKKSADAQQESSKILQEQLRITKVSSDLDVLTNYISRLNNSHEENYNEKIKLAKQIIDLKIKDIYLKPEFFHLIKPNLYISSKKLNIDNAFDYTSMDYKFKFTLGNSGNSFLISSAIQEVNKSPKELFRSNLPTSLPIEIEAIYEKKMDITFNLWCKVTSLNWQVRMIVYPNYSNQILIESIILNSNGKAIIKDYGVK